MITTEMRTSANCEKEVCDGMDLQFALTRTHLPRLIWKLKSMGNNRKAFCRRWCDTLKGQLKTSRLHLDQDFDRVKWRKRSRRVDFTSGWNKGWRRGLWRRYTAPYLENQSAYFSFQRIRRSSSPDLVVGLFTCVLDRFRSMVLETYLTNSWLKNWTVLLVLIHSLAKKWK